MPVGLRVTNHDVLSLRTLDADIVAAVGLRDAEHMHPEGVLELRQILENLALVDQERHDSFQVRRGLLEVRPELQPGLAVHDRIHTLKILLVKEAHDVSLFPVLLLCLGYSLIIHQGKKQSTNINHGS